MKHEGFLDRNQKLLPLLVLLLAAEFVWSQSQFSYMVVGGASFTVTINGYIGSETDLIIPGMINGWSVTGIWQRTFAQNRRLTSVTIPDSVITIGEYAFHGCTSLARVTIPDGVISLGNGAFSGCTSLTGVTIPGSVTAIGTGPVSLWEERSFEGVFSACTSLTSVTIPNSVTSIGYGAFSGCTNLTNVVIPNSVTSIGNSAFSDCSSLTNVTIPNSVSDVGPRAFSGCTSLTSLMIPSSVASIGSQAFYGCRSPTSVTIPNSVARIGEAAFSGFIGLTNVTIPNSVTNIGDDAFRGCTGLASVTIPNSVTRIGNSTFSDCISLTNVTIPDTVTSLGDDAFRGCVALISITIPNSVTSIGDKAFRGCASLSNITIPDRVTRIGGGTFYGCTSLASAVIPNSVTSIEGYTAVSGDYRVEGAFEGCSSLTNVTIPNSVTSIDEQTFKGCTSLIAVTVESLNNAYSSVDGVLFSKDQTTLIFCPEGKAGAYRIPETVITITFQTSGPWGSGAETGGAFWDCSKLSSVTVPNSVTSIGRLPFSGCASLTAIVVDAQNLVYSSVDGVLFDKSQATLMQCPGAKSGNYSVPNTATCIGGSAFSDCSSLINVTIPNSVTNMGPRAFSGCTSLRAITVDALNPAYSSVDGVLFNKNQTTLTMIPGGKAGSYSIPSSVSSIGESAFYRCTRLSSIVIPNSVTNIESQAFSRCTFLTGVYFTGNAPDSVGEIFDWWSPDDGDLVRGPVTVYYLPGSKYWGAMFGGRSTALWLPDLRTTEGTLGVQTNRFGFAISWASDKVVTIEACTDLINPVWIPVSTNTLAGGTAYFSDPEWAKYPSRFYRVRAR